MSIRRQLGDLAKSLDSSAVGSFLSKGASEADFTTISYSDVSGTPSVVADSAVATSIIDSAYVSARVITVAAGLDSATTINLLDSNYMAARSGGGAGFYVYNYDATAGQTTFQDSDAAGNVMSYSADGIIVFYNGVMLPTADYTATDGTSVVLGSAADSQDVVTIAKWSVGGGGSGAGGSSFSWGGDRGLVMGGYSSFANTYANIIEYWDITSTGNASDFGDLSTTNYQGVGISDGTYAYHAKGAVGGSTKTNTIDYVTVATTSNATDFGDAIAASSQNGAQGACDASRAVMAGQDIDGVGYTNQIEYFICGTPGNSSDFGDLSVGRISCTMTNDATRGVVLGGYESVAGWVNTCEYITIQTTGDATDFGDLTEGVSGASSAGDTTYGLRAAGYGSGSSTNTIDYITIQTPSNATDFGDLLAGSNGGGGCSNGTYGHFTGGWTGSALVADINNVVIATPGNATDHGDLTYGVQNGPCASGSPS